MRETMQEGNIVWENWQKTKYFAIFSWTHFISKLKSKHLEKLYGIGSLREKENLEKDE